MTSYRQLQNDDLSDQFDLDSQSDGYRSRELESSEVHIEPTRARTKSRVRLPTTTCTKNKAIIVLVVMVLIVSLIAAVAFYKLAEHGAHGDNDAILKATTLPTTKVKTTTTTHSPTTTTVSPETTTRPMTADGKVFPWSDIRLPEAVKPFSYELFIHPDLTTFEVRGNVSIHFNAIKQVDTIILHAREMNITKPESVTIVEPQVSSIQVEELLTYENHEQVAVKLVQPIAKGTHGILNLSFNYTLHDGLEGFYRSSYKKEGETRYIATTQFEASSARMAFPCFDEPAMKANFSLKIVHTNDYITLFNMPANQSDVPLEEGGDLVYDVYPPTLPMSTYLVAFVVSDFVNISAVTSGGTKVAVYAPEEMISQAQLALEVVNETIPFYESFFNISYPLPKQDMIAIPDFSAGAMENWGLITYRESSVLYKPNVTSSHQEAWIVITVTHELAHQWFGNLVTMSWWNDLWLNEGFASFVEYIGGNHFRPEWRMMDTFILYTTQRAMGHDQKANSHPITVNVTNPGEISQIFDAISYSKGATILKMLQHFLMKDGEDRMIKGIQNYLKQFKFGNAATNDLWTAISQATDNEDDVAGIMDTWTLQMGFPMLNMTRSGKKIVVTQQRFLIYPEGEPSTEFNSSYGYKWMVPLTYFFDSNTSAIKSEVLQYNQESTSLSIPKSAKWFKANSKQSGMYRVNYDTDTWKALVKQLQSDHTVLDAADRTSLIDDAFSLALAGYIDYEIPLNLSRYLLNEDEYVPLDAGISSLGVIGGMLYGREGYTYYKEYILKQFTRKYNDLGFEDTGAHLERLTRQTLLATFRSIGHGETLKWASGKYKDWMETNTTSVGVNLRGVVQCGGIEYGHEEEWDFAWNRYLTTTSPTEKSTLLMVLACTQDPTLLNKYLHWSLDSDKVRKQDSDSVITDVASNPAGGYMAFRFVIENWDTIKDGIGEQMFVMSSLITGTTSWITTTFEYNIAKQFFEEHESDVEQGTRAIRQSLEDMRMRINWLEKNEKYITAWLKEATRSKPASA